MIEQSVARGESQNLNLHADYKGGINKGKPRKIHANGSECLFSICLKKRLVSPPRSSATFLVVKTQSQCSASAFAFLGARLHFYMLRVSEIGKRQILGRESRFSCSSARAYCVNSMLPRPAGVFSFEPQSYSAPPPSSAPNSNRHI